MNGRRNFIDAGEKARSARLNRSPLMGLRSFFGEWYPGAETAPGFTRPPLCGYQIQASLIGSTDRTYSGEFARQIDILASTRFISLSLTCEHLRMEVFGA